MKLLSLLIFILFSHCSFPQSTAKPANNTKKAIICLTYDDGLASHLSIAIPQLDSVGLKATFFLNSISGAADVLGQSSPAVTGWRKAAQNGHELANHTLFHPCPGKLGWAKEVAIESYSLEQLLKEITTANALLNLLDEKRKIRTFAYPCNNSIVAGKDYSAMLKKSGLVTYARWGGDRSSVVADLKKTNPMQVPSWLVEEGATLGELIEFAEKAKRTGGMGVYQFHGIGGQFFKISPETHKSFLAYLKENQQYFWVTTFAEAMDFVTAK